MRQHALPHSPPKPSFSLYPLLFLLSLFLSLFFQGRVRVRCGKKWGGVERGRERPRPTGWSLGEEGGVRGMVATNAKLAWGWKREKKLYHAHQPGAAGWRRKVTGDWEEGTSK